MIKLIRTDQLKPGMYIHNLNCGWIILESYDKWKIDPYQWLPA